MMTRTHTMSPKAQFDEIGFYRHPESVMAPDLIARSVQAIEDIRGGVYETGQPPLFRNWNPGDPPEALAKLDDPHLSNRVLLDALVDSGVGELAGEILGAEWVQAWAVQGLHKPPSQEKTNRANVGWHQDQFYWDEIFEPGSVLCTAWLALSDVGPDSGPVLFVPGSHTWGKVQGNFFEQDQDKNRSNIEIPTGATWDMVENVLPAGGVSFHHQWLLHGSNQNSSTRPRLSLAIHLRTEQSKPQSLDHVLTKDLDNPEICPIIFRQH